MDAELAITCRSSRAPLPEAWLASRRRGAAWRCGGAGSLLATLIRIQPGVVWLSLAHGYTFLLCMSVDPYLLKALLDGADGRAGLGSSLCIVFLYQI